MSSLSHPFSGAPHRLRNRPPARVPHPPRPGCRGSASGSLATPVSRRPADPWPNRTGQESARQPPPPVRNLALAPKFAAAPGRRQMSRAADRIGCSFVAPRSPRTEPAGDFDDAADESESAAADHQPRRSVQPPIREIAQKAGEKDGSYYSKWQFHCESRLVGYVARSLFRLAEIWRIIWILAHAISRRAIRRRGWWL